MLRKLHLPLRVTRPAVDMAVGKVLKRDGAMRRLGRALDATAHAAFTLLLRNASRRTLESDSWRPTLGRFAPFKGGN